MKRIPPNSPPLCTTADVKSENSTNVNAITESSHGADARITRLILVRHGESKANESDLFAGHSDFPLTEKGHLQAKLSAEYIVKNYTVDSIYASDLKRAYFTAFPIAKKTEIPIIPDKELREIYAGKWESMPFSEIPAVYPDEFSLWRNDIGSSRCPCGESVRELGERIVKRLKEIAEENRGKTVVVATHATPIRAVQTMCECGDIAEMQKTAWVPNASVTEIEYADGELKLKSAGIADHLNTLLTELPKDI